MYLESNVQLYRLVKIADECNNCVGDGVQEGCCRDAVAEEGRVVDGSRICMHVCVKGNMMNWKTERRTDVFVYVYALSGNVSSECVPV